jgi:hypothetical protein
VTLKTCKLTHSRSSGSASGGAGGDAQLAVDSVGNAVRLRKETSDLELVLTNEEQPLGIQQIRTEGLLARANDAQAAVAQQLLQRLKLIAMTDALRSRETDSSLSFKALAHGRTCAPSRAQKQPSVAAKYPSKSIQAIT